MLDFWRVARVVTLGGVVASTVAGCNARQPLVAKDPDVVTPGGATGPDALPVLRAGTIGDFAIAVVGAANVSNNGNEGIASWGGIFTDEFEDKDTFPTRSQMNTRDATAVNSSIAGQFANMGAVHNDAVRALAQYAKFGPSTVGQAEMFNVDGMMYIYTAEHFCSGVPFSTIDVATGKVTNSPFLTTPQMLDTALARFVSAQQALATDTSDGPADIKLQREFATVATARALLDLGQVGPAADTAATMTDAGFAYQILESVNSTRQENGVWNYTDPNQTQAFSVGDRKNGTGLPFVSSPDPRVPFFISGAPANNGDPVFVNQSKYPTSTTNFTVADFTEAQLIVAEGKIESGNYAAGKAMLDAMRATVGLAALPDSSGAGPKAEMQQLLSERAYWLYVTGHRLGDWRRVLRLPYSAAPFSFVQADVFPAVGSPGDHILSLPTPQQTNPNPNYVACDPSQP
jgi:hypothetical protein